MTGGHKKRCRKTQVLLYTAVHTLPGQFILGVLQPFPVIQSYGVSGNFESITPKLKHQCCKEGRDDEHGG